MALWHSTRAKAGYRGLLGLLSLNPPTVPPNFNNLFTKWTKTQVLHTDPSRRLTNKLGPL